MKELKITKLDNGFLIKVVDLEADRRVPVAKYVALTLEDLTAIIQMIYKLKVA